MNVLIIYKIRKKTHLYLINLKMLKNYFFEISEENYFNHTFTTINKFKLLNVIKIILDSQVYLEIFTVAIWYYIFNII